MRKPKRNIEPLRALIYAKLLPVLIELARSMGYALAVHGSMATDLDLVAVPWTDDAVGADDLAAAVKAVARGYEHPDIPNRAERSHGRLVWSFYFDHDCRGAYIDLSITPRICDSEKSNPREIKQGDAPVVEIGQGDARAVVFKTGVNEYEC